MSTSDKYTNSKLTNLPSNSLQPTSIQPTSVESNNVESITDQAGDHHASDYQVETEQKQQMMQILNAARNQHFQAGLPWVYQDENCLQDNWVIRQYADGRKLLVELLAQGKENILKHL